MRRVTFAAGLEAHGDRPAVIAGGITLTYAELARRADALAERLGPGRKLVLVHAGNDLGSVVAYVAVLRAGHVALVTGARSDVHSDALRATYEPDVVVRSSADGCDVDVEAHVGGRGGSSAHVLHADLALLLSTSGSTGSPKLVRLSHRNVESNAEAIATYLALSPADRAITSLPMHYCYGLSVVNSHLAAGAGIVVTDRSVVDRCFWDTFTAASATSFAGVPHTFDLLDRVGFAGMDLPTLRYVTQAGGRLAPDVVRRYGELGRRRGWQLFVMYGQTEATARMAYLPPERATSHPRCIGVPIPGGHLDIAPVEGCRDGEGELVYRGPNVMLGYAHQPSDLASGATVDVLRTGDLARRTADGMFQVVGRRSRFAKLFGLRIDLDHVEAMLRDVGVRAVCVSDDEQLLVVAESAAHDDLVRATVRDRLALPASAVRCVVAPVPRLASGKPDYEAAREIARRGAADDAPTQTRAPSRHDRPQVIDLYRRVLRRPDATEDDTFVSLGGDSLSYVEMSVALEKALGQLPADWPTTPIGALRPAARRRAWLRPMETNVVVRAAAIFLIVATHAELFVARGGAHTLLAVAGFNFARFQLVSGRMARSVARVAVPSMAWIALVAAAHDDVGLSNALLVNGITGASRSWSFWYIEALVHLLVPLAALFAIPAVRRCERVRPLAFATAVLVLGLLVRFDLLGLPDPSRRAARPHEILWLFALGWVAALATAPRHRVALTAVAAVSAYGFFGQPARELIVLCGLVLLVWVRNVRVPWPLPRLVAEVANASLAIYLTHWSVYPPVRDRLGPAAATVAAIAVGVAVSRAVASAASWTARMRAHAPARAVAPVPDDVFVRT